VDAYRYSNSRPPHSTLTSPALTPLSPSCRQHRLFPLSPSPLKPAHTPLILLTSLRNSRASSTGAIQPKAGPMAQRATSGSQAQTIVPRRPHRRKLIIFPAHFADINPVETLSHEADATTCTGRRVLVTWMTISTAIDLPCHHLPHFVGRI